MYNISISSPNVFFAVPRQFAVTTEHTCRPGIGYRREASNILFLFPAKIFLLKVALFDF